MKGYKYLMETKVKVLYDANKPQIAEKIGVVKSYPNFICGDYWYDIEINGKLYDCCSAQLTFV